MLKKLLEIIKNHNVPNNAKFVVERLEDKNFKDFEKDCYLFVPKAPFEHLTSELVYPKDISFKKETNEIVIWMDKIEEYNVLSFPDESKIIKEIKYFWTVGYLLEILKDIEILENDSIMVERVEDIYFKRTKDKKGWPVEEIKTTDGLYKELITINNMNYSKKKRVLVLWLHII